MGFTKKAVSVFLLVSITFLFSGCNMLDLFRPVNTEPSYVFFQVTPTPVPNETDNNYEGSDPVQTTPLYMAVDDVDFSTFLFVGDSRTVGMSNVVQMNTIAEVGVGYNFLAAHRSEIISMENMNIVFNLGVNDLANLDKYIEFFQQLPEEFTWNNNLYVVSVNPCKGEYEYMNDDITYFNVQLSDSLPSLVRYIDTNSYLTAVGFDSPDGLHYSAETYETIAVLIYNNIEFYQYQGY